MSNVVSKLRNIRLHVSQIHINKMVL